FLVTLGVLWCILHSTPIVGVFVTLGLSATVLIIGQVAYNGWNGEGGIWVHISQPLVGIFLSYYIAVPYRLIREYKQRWEFQKKNTILKQVEELKTNFLSLVTHDLKTPVARIQGLSEMILKQETLTAL